MKHANFDKKIRFSYFLPYGFTSVQATILAVNYEPACAFQEYNKDMSMEERVKFCTNARTQRSKAIGSMKKYGYIEESRYKFGNPHWDTFSMYRLTKSGFYFITNTPDDELERQRVANSPQIQNRYKKETYSYLPSSERATQERNTLYKLSKKGATDKKAASEFERLFLASVSSEDFSYLSILATQPALAESVSMTPILKRNQMYQAYKLSNIEALFKANQFLTSLDRRQIPLPPTPHIDQETPLDIPTFTRYALNTWYESHPESYLYLLPQEDTADYIRDDWSTRPTFYSIADIPNFGGMFVLETNMNTAGANQNMRHTCMGVAVGKKQNYIVHHTKPVQTPWYENIEKSTVNAVQKSLDLVNKTSPNMGANRVIRNAIIVCPSPKQFASLFKEAKEPLPENRNGIYRVGKPYDSVCIVPVNHSGAMQLRGLMATSPMEFEEIIKRSILKQSDCVERQKGWDEKDNIFPLLYKGKPVLLAHTMNWQKLFWATEMYHQGKEFIVSCYPEQVAYIRTIMPNVKYL